MRCLSKGCNNLLSDYEAVRKYKTGGYVDKCTFCEPTDKSRHEVESWAKFKGHTRFAGYNENDGLEPALTKDDKLPYNWTFIAEGDDYDE